MPVQPTVAVIVVAAGSGTRLGRPEPKAFAPLAGRPILAHALDRVFGMSEPAQVIVVAPASHHAVGAELATSIAGAAAEYVTVVAGGASRQASVAAGLAALWPSVDTVLVHDAARALTPSEQFDLVVRRVTESRGGVTPALPVTDTIKRVGPDIADSAGALHVTDAAVRGTVDRSELVAVQTPQGFPRAALLDAYAAAAEEYTDDAALFAAAGGPVRTVAGAADAFKITTPWDLRRAEQELAPDAAPHGVRTGLGIDVHAFDAATPLWLGGVHWPGEPGLAGHSDGDALSHAICDALLGAAGLGDIGSRFGTADPQLENARGDVFLTATVALLRDAGFSIGNVAVQVIANHPKLGPRRHEVEAHLSGIVGAPVSVAATTSDHLGFTGRGEGIAAIATALVQQAT
ncbi:2-C-methyl-D-erythritol 4-phosphate cytidylyltransferase [Salinibacterium sp. ZJ454]|uniref:2-C-methyl-D-erythritol 4-phosphate cytidylyltransferase n=1 Tax=Salinibacterium sp. ZJ454 TaxID=2708339 RepID=UPI00142362AA|nr:2-C-methyl-D-erythritol 4-phosphate cytidylyltransferase [Salinibacterium sp. ZJ454]